jgi:hypothetical protein
MHCVAWGGGHVEVSRGFSQMAADKTLHLLEVQRGTEHQHLCAWGGGIV